MGGTKHPGVGMGAVAQMDGQSVSPAVASGGIGSAAASAGLFDGMYSAPRPTTPSGMGSAAFDDMAQLDRALANEATAGGSVGRAVPSTFGLEPPPPPLSAFDQAAGEQQGTLDALQKYLLDNPVVHGSKANALRPIAEQAAQDFHGGGPLAVDPFQYQASTTAIPRNEGETDEQYAARVAEFEAADIQGQLESYQRGIGEQVANAQTLGDVRDIGKSGHLGMKEAKVQAAEGVGAASLEQQERVAQVQSQAAQMQMQATDAARQADLERRQFANVQRDAIAKIQETQKAAAAKVAALPELDPNRSFKSMSGGAKFWAVLGSLAGGAIGSTDVNDRLFAIAQNDLEAQKANAAQTFDAAAAADSAVGQQMGLYRELLAAAGDEAAADAMFLQAQLGDAAQLIEAELAQTTVPVMKAQLQSSLVDMRERINHEQMKIDTMLATTPERIATSFDPIGGRQRRLIEGQIKDERNFQQDLTKLGVDVEQKGLDRQGKLDEKMAERQTKLAEKTADKDFEIKKAADEWGAVETLVGDFMTAHPAEIDGVGAPLTGSQSDRIRTRQFTRALELLATSGFTGATASDRQAEQIKSMVTGDWTELSDEAFRTRMGEIMNIASSRRRFYQNSLGSPDPRIGDPTKAGGLSTFQPE